VISKRVYPTLERKGIIRLQGRAHAAEFFNGLESLARAVEAHILQCDGTIAHCRGCGRTGWMRQPATTEGDWPNLLEGLLCGCGLNGRMRMILVAVDTMLMTETVHDAVVFERVTPLFTRLLERIPRLQGSEYLGDDAVPGEVRAFGGLEVRHESLLSPSYHPSSMDMVMHFDVLEHVPDIDEAMRQCYSLLRPGGTLLFSCPFYEGLDRSLVRATVEDGRVRHLLEPCFHGNPVDDGGSLVFTHPGWDLLERIAASGFENVSLLLCYDLAEGIVSNACPYPDGHVWPVAFTAKKTKR
jgi:SAM-dependent methyltransferase